jgi:hypothetical protein
MPIHTDGEWVSRAEHERALQEQVDEFAQLGASLADKNERIDELEESTQTRKIIIMPTTDLEHAQLRVEAAQLKLNLLEAQNRVIQLQHPIIQKELEQAQKEWQDLKDAADAQVEQTLTHRNGDLRE